MTSYDRVIQGAHVTIIQHPSGATVSIKSGLFRKSWVVSRDDLEWFANVLTHLLPVLRRTP